MKNPNFLIIDSGVGGLSIWQEIQQLIPNSHTCYVADNGAYPYGTLEEQVLVQRLLQLLPELERQYQPDIIVIACNTASTVVLDPLRAQTNTPVIGVVPAIKPAAACSQSKQVTLLATPGTIQRRYIDRLIEDFGNGCRFLRIGSNQLVHEAEQKIRGKPVNRAIIHEVLAPLQDSHTDVLILGCTHFPILLQEIRAAIPAHIRILDSGAAIARRAQQLLIDLPPAEGKTRLPGNLFLFTAETEQAHLLEAGIKHFGFDKIRFFAPNATQFEQKSGAT
ncbi:MAG: glutamate racemase [Pseudomonadales bacterium]|nr:glutamate racemase [Pseudomonadales bacterium]RLU02849.1 MAG: glutamate racemase [Ketobacter sp.]